MMYVQSFGEYVLSFRFVSDVVGRPSFLHHHTTPDTQEGTSVDQMMRMLLGEHAEAVQRHDMALFLRAVFTARPEMELHQELDW
jgi:hypothetical protein